MIKALSTPPELEVPRLSDVLFARSDFGFDGLALLPSNLEAVEAATLFASGIHCLVAIVGPSGWGKSMILHGAAMQTTSPGTTLNPPQVLCASDWVADLPRIDAQRPLILDNVQDILHKSRLKIQLRMALERRARAGKPTMLGFTMPKATRQLRGFLPFYREWVVATIGSPAPQEKEVIVRHMAAMAGLRLSSELVRILAAHLRGTGCTLAGALNTLRLQKTNWMDGRATLHACGILHAFFADNSAWDLRDRIYAEVRSRWSLTGTQRVRDLSLFLMLRVARLSETSVARYFDIEQAGAYSRALRFEDAMSGDNELAREVDLTIDNLVKTLHIA
jgi:hypothetical protein